MIVEWRGETGPGLPLPASGHGLAWSYLSDRVVADAYHAGVAALHLALPQAHGMLVRARASLAAGPGTEKDAWFGPEVPSGPGFARAYRLRYSPTFGAFRRRTRPAPEGWELAWVVHVYTLTSRAWGAAMAVASASGWPAAADRARRRMQRSFQVERAAPAHYRLEAYRWIGRG